VRDLFVSVNRAAEKTSVQRRPIVTLSFVFGFNLGANFRAGNAYGVAVSPPAAQGPSSGTHAKDLSADDLANVILSGLLHITKSSRLCGWKRD
jgi:hypothetical protein